MGISSRGPLKRELSASSRDNFKCPSQDDIYPAPLHPLSPNLTPYLRLHLRLREGRQCRE